MTNIIRHELKGAGSSWPVDTNRPVTVRSDGTFQNLPEPSRRFQNNCQAPLYACAGLEASGTSLSDLKHRLEDTTGVLACEQQWLTGWPLQKLEVRVPGPCRLLVLQHALSCISDSRAIIREEEGSEPSRDSLLCWLTKPCIAKVAASSPCTTSWLLEALHLQPQPHV